MKLILYSKNHLIISFYYRTASTQILSSIPLTSLFPASDLQCCKALRIENRGYNSKIGMTKVYFMGKQKSRGHNVIIPVITISGRYDYVAPEIRVNVI